MATRKDELIKYGRKLLKNEGGLWRDPEIIAEVLGLAEDTEHRGDILLDIESKFSEKKVSMLTSPHVRSMQTYITDLFMTCMCPARACSCDGICVRSGCSTCQAHLWRRHWSQA